MNLNIRIPYNRFYLEIKQKYNYIFALDYLKHINRHMFACVYFMNSDYYNKEEELYIENKCKSSNVDLYTYTIGGKSEQQIRQQKIYIIESLIGGPLVVPKVLCDNIQFYIKNRLLRKSPDVIPEFCLNGKVFHPFVTVSDDDINLFYKETHIKQDIPIIHSDNLLKSIQETYLYDIIVKNIKHYYIGRNCI